MDRTEKIIEIAEHYGYDAQSRQCIEEMAELTQAINKFYRKVEFGKLNNESIEQLKDNMLEEIADVQIMLYQMFYFLNSRENLNSVIDKKLQRQLKRIREESKVTKNTQKEIEDFWMDK